MSTTEFRMELADCTATLLREIADRRATQRDVAVTYLWARASSEPTDWPRVNRAIMDRWSPSGLVRLKRIAERLLKERATPTPTEP